MNTLIEKWKSKLFLKDWEIITVGISESQVWDEKYDPNPIGHEFVGIEYFKENKKATIYHTRQLKEEDILHELLHVRYPDWSEKQVCDACDDFLNK